MDNSRDLSILQPVPHNASTVCMYVCKNCIHGVALLLLGCEPNNSRPIWYDREPNLEPYCIDTDAYFQGTTNTCKHSRKKLNENKNIW